MATISTIKVNVVQPDRMLDVRARVAQIIPRIIPVDIWVLKLAILFVLIISFLNNLFITYFVDRLFKNGINWELKITSNHDSIIA
jgi:hypothetical protein